MLKIILSVIALVPILAGFANAQQMPKGNDSFTIYLVRHGEKQPDQKDPDLTSCGLNRAEYIAKQLELVKIKHIYSTDYNRTMQTAAPIAKQRSLAINHYNPNQLPEFSKQLIDNKQNAIVVGHSNTTAVLAGLLIAEPGQPFAEDVYDRVYQVMFINGVSHLQILQQGFYCS